MRRLLFIFLCINTHTLLEAKDIEKPAPRDPQERVLIHRSIKVDSETAKVFSDDKLPLISEINRPDKLKHPFYKTHSLHDLAPLAKAVQKKTYELGSQEWIIFNSTTSDLHMYVDERLSALFRERFLAPELIQLKIQIDFVAVDRQEGHFTQWSKKRVEQANPSPLINVNFTSRSGEKNTLRSQIDAQTVYEFECEPTLSDDSTVADIRVCFSCKGDAEIPLEYNSGITVLTGADFIHPIGISTNPKRQSVMILRADVINSKGEIIQPQR
ncbi:hypothetical protein [Rubritalea sp.]|uniref:hypothetical protein n=1 Tax=Rubritalea sp. TaxID=2109375 RepID=UPI003EF1D07A